MVTMQMAGVTVDALFSVPDQTPARFAYAVLDRVAAVVRGDHGEPTAARLLRMGVSYNGEEEGGGC